MMKIDEILEMWKTDCVPDNIDLDTQSLTIPSLHAKYLAIRAEYGMKLKSAQLRRRKLWKTLFDYYSGNLNTPEDLKRINREPQELRVMKQDMGMYIEGDEEMLLTDAQIETYKNTLAALDEILKSINNRGFQISNAIKWRQLTQFGDI